MIPKNKFSQADLKELETFLFSDQVPDECMDISTLHGYLTCLAIGPETVVPSKWLPDIWGAEMVWDDMEETEHIIGLIMSFYNSIIKAVTSPTGKFKPLLESSPAQNEKSGLLENWCTGFMLAVDLTIESWKPLMYSESDQELLGLIMLFGTDSGKEKQKDFPAQTLQDLNKYAIAIGDAVKSINRYWLPYRKDVHKSTHQAISNKVGRNDPCPCGSGKKFKLCCMN